MSLFINVFKHKNRETGEDYFTTGSFFFPSLAKARENDQVLPHLLHTIDVVTGERFDKDGVAIIE